MQWTGVEARFRQESEMLKILLGADGGVHLDLGLLHPREAILCYSVANND